MLYMGELLFYFYQNEANLNLCIPNIDSLCVFLILKRCKIITDIKNLGHKVIPFMSCFPPPPLGGRAAGRREVVQLILQTGRRGSLFL